MGQKQQILSAIKSAAQSVDATAEVLLFGSRARGDEHEESDWNILILVDKEINLAYEWQYQRPFLEIELEYSICISKLIINKNRWNSDYLNYPLHMEIQKDGQLL